MFKFLYKLMGLIILSPFAIISFIFSTFLLAMILLVFMGGNP